MPARITVHLTSTAAHRPVPPPHTGPAVSAAFLAALRDAGEGDLSSALHDKKPPKPFALTPLMDERDQLAERTSAQVRFEVGVVLDSLVAPILQALATTSNMRVAKCLYDVAAVELTAAEPYPELLAASLPSTRWTLDIRTPVAFFTAREEGVRRTRPFPQPEWVLADLYRRWNAFGVPLNGSVAEAIAGNVEVADHRLSMAEHLVHARAPLARGSVGEISYGLADTRPTTPEGRTALDALIRFSAYAGIGDRTTLGMGYVLPTPR
ncbi:MAG: CRISPR system precrRNA processing endoribonuclease RAMP protein Cas6 [Streptosporangiaceae bacterium]